MPKMLKYGTNKNKKWSLCYKFGTFLVVCIKKKSIVRVGGCTIKNLNNVGGGGDLLEILLATCLVESDHNRNFPIRHLNKLGLAYEPRSHLKWHEHKRLLGFLMSKKEQQ